MIHNGAVRLYKIDGDSLRLAGNRQECGFEMFQTPGEASANHRFFPSDRLGFERRAIVAEEPLRVPRVQAFRDSDETHQSDGTGGQRSAFIKDLNARIHIEGQPQPALQATSRIRGFPSPTPS